MACTIRQNTSPSPTGPKSLWAAACGLARRAAKPLAAAALVMPGLLGVSPSAASADGYETVTDEGVVQLGEFSGAAYFDNDPGHYLLFNKWVNEGVGFRSGFSSIGLHTTLKDWGLTHIYTDNRVLITDHSRVGYNGLVGVRRLVGDGIVGGWLGYDNWESDNGFRYDQISFGGEALFGSIDFRANGYVPMDSDEVNFAGIQTLNARKPSFRGNNLFFNDTAVFEESVGGWDAEVGTRILPGVRGYAGLYGLYPDLQDSTVGFRWRAEVRATEEVNVQFIGSNDDLYGDSFNVVAEVLFSGRPNAVNILPCFDPGYRKHGQVRRNWPVATLQTRRNVQTVATLNGDPLRFTFVDNTNTGGTGTFENPFEGLPMMANGSDFILVDTGVGNTIGNITLKPGQQLIGEGRPFTIDTDRGTFRAPIFDSISGPPTLQSAVSGEPVIRLADNTSVSNFNIVGDAATTAITGDMVANFDVNRVFIDSGAGIRVDDATGSSVIRNSTFRGGVREAIFVDAGANLDLDVRNVNASGDGDLVVFRSDGGDASFSVTDSEIAGSTGGSGVTMNVTVGSGDLTVADTILSRNAGDGVRVVAGPGGTATATLSDLTINVVGGDGVRVVADDGGSSAATITDVEAVGSGSSGLSLRAGRPGGVGTVDVVVADSEFTNSFADNVMITSVTPGSSADLMATNITADGSRTGSGLSVDAKGGGTSTVMVTGSSFDDNELDGVRAFATGTGSFADLQFIGSSADRNGLAGFRTTSQNFADMVVDLRNTTANDNGSSGLRADSLRATSFALFVDGDSAFNANSADGGDAVEITTDRTQLVGIQFAGDITNTVGTGTGLYANVVDAVIAAVELGDASIMGSDIQNNQDDGVFVRIAGQPGTRTRVDNQTVGIGKNAGRTIQGLSLTNLDVSDNRQGGIAVFLREADVAAGVMPSIDGNTARDNIQDDGILLSIVDSNVEDVFSVSDNIAADNGGFGIDVFVLNSTINGIETNGNVTVGNGEGDVRVRILP